MAVKFNNQEATYLIALHQNGGLLCNKILKEIETIKNYDIYNYSKAELKSIIASKIACYKEIKEFYKNIKLFDKAEIYSVHSWGYEQTNLENVIAIGKYKNTVIVLGEHEVYSVATHKYNKKEYTNLDKHGVRSTSWKAPYSNKKIAEQHSYNMMYGH